MKRKERRKGGAIVSQSRNGDFCTHSRYHCFVRNEKLVFAVIFDEQKRDIDKKKESVKKVTNCITKEKEQSKGNEKEK